MVRRLLGRLGMWCLRRSRVNRIEARLGADDRAPLALVLVVFREDEHTPALLANLVKAYCGMRGIHVEIGKVVLDDEPDRPELPHAKGVH